jgi:hypothetical protein
LIAHLHARLVAEAAAGGRFRGLIAHRALGIGLAASRRMRNRWVWAFVGVVMLVFLAQYFGLSAMISARVTSLASQPGVSTAFQHPDTGRTDALTALIAFAVLTPIALFFALLALVLVAKAFETLVVSVHLPGWLSAPVVGIAAVVTMYVTSQTWVPPSVYGLGLIARAYLVYAHGAVPIIR